MPRMTTFFTSLPVMMNPPMSTLSPVSTRRRVATLRSCAGVGVGVALGVGAGVAVGVVLGVGDAAIPVVVKEEELFCGLSSSVEVLAAEPVKVNAPVA